MEENMFVCDHCGRTVPLSQRWSVGGHDLCECCVEEDTVFCVHCGVRILREDNAGTESAPLCQDCFDTHYTRCQRCGRLIHRDNCYYPSIDSDTPHCYDCYQALREGIHDYYFKPAPIFYGDGPRYMGVELEIDCGGEDGDNANTVLAICNGLEERAYAKHDGSLDEGFEIVSHPMTLKYHMEEMPWKEMMQKAINLHYLSHQACTCGLHVHVSRKAFGDTEEAQDACIARILYFFEKHWEELLKFSRRTRGQLEQWAARYGYKDQPREVLETAKKGNLGRYTCVNLTNTDTIEFRMWRGTLKYNTLIATLQLVNRICDIALYLSDEEVKNLSWTSFVAGCTEPELVQYLKERRLYVNDTVSGEAEI